MQNIETLLAQRAEIDAQLKEHSDQVKAVAITKIKALAAEAKLTASDLKGIVSGKRTVKPAVAKFRNPETGVTWAGRGRVPLWMRVDGAETKFAIRGETQE